jgi:hypothetical protein
MANTAAHLYADPAPSNPDIAYLASELVQITLPHSDPGEIPIWTRRNGDQVLSIRPAYRAGSFLGYPYGTIPRLLLLWITTEVKRTGSRRLYLGGSLADFMRRLGLDPGPGGPRSDRARLQHQSERFFRSVFSNDYAEDTKTRARTSWHDVQIAPRGDLWWHYTDNGGRTVFDGWIDLGEDAYAMFASSPVPVDMRVVRAIKNSSLALDLNVWTAYKTFIATTKGQPQRVPFRGLMQQLGADYSEVRGFRRKTKEVLDRLCGFYPGINISYYRGGVEIRPGRLVVPARAGAAKSL